MRRLGYVGTALAAVVLLGACGDSSDTDDAEGTVTDSPSGSTPSGSTPDPSRPPAVQGAVADLAANQSVAESDVEVIGVEAVTWRDGSLGCAEPGKMYTQALVDGQRITLAVAGTEFEYHVGGDGEPFLCEDPTQ